MSEIVIIDERGRVVIPAAERKKRRITAGDRFRLSGQGKSITLEPLIEEPKKISTPKKWGRKAFLCAGEATFGE